MIEQILILFLIHTVRFHPMDFSSLAQRIYSQATASPTPSFHATSSNQSNARTSYQEKPSQKYSGSLIVVHLKYLEKFKRICPDQMHVLPAICYSENRSEDPESIGPGGVGICQINKIHQWRAGSGSLMNPDVNIRVACQIIREQGANPWTDFRNGLFRRFTIAQ